MPFDTVVLVRISKKSSAPWRKIETLTTGNTDAELVVCYSQYSTV